MNRRAQEYAECLSWVLGFAKSANWEPDCRALLGELQQRFSAEAREATRPRATNEPRPAASDFDAALGRCQSRASDGRRCNKNSGHKDDHHFWPIAAEA